MMYATVAAVAVVVVVLVVACKRYNMKTAAPVCFIIYIIIIMFFFFNLYLLIYINWVLLNINCSICCTYNRQLMRLSLKREQLIIILGIVTVSVQLRRWLQGLFKQSNVLIEVLIEMQSTSTQARHSSSSSNTISQLEVFSCHLCSASTLPCVKCTVA